MTRQELLQRIFRKNGTAVTFGKKQGFAVICPFGMRRTDIPERWLYTSVGELLPEVGQCVHTAKQDYIVTRSGTMPLGDGTNCAWAHLEPEQTSIWSGEGSAAHE